MYNKDLKRMKLLKEFVLMPEQEDQKKADEQCFYCELYDGRDGIGEKACKFKSICGTDKEELKKELSIMIDTLMREKIF
jgi:hypothetical protein